MKSIKIFTTLLILSLPTALSANPFRKSWVCVPKIIPNQRILEFTISESETCGPKETAMKVVKNPQGGTLLLPYERPLDPETKKDLENFKKYYGIDR